MIITEIMCGMGNQMFQYAFARALQEKHRKNQRIQFQFVTAGRMRDGREYALKHCVLRPDIRIPGMAEQRLIDMVWKLRLKLLKRQFAGLESYAELAKRGIYHTESIFRYLGLPDAPGKNVYINGWWQSPKYFEDIAEDIRRELRIKTAASEKNRKLLEKIRARGDSSVCVHVRLGDYCSDKFAKELAVCGREYYHRAFGVIRSKVADPHFFVFSTSSEDIRWIRDNWDFPENSTFVDLDNPDYEELRLMYSCRHFILANSTFSWWAAYLSENRQQVCIAPSVWNRRDREYKDLYMDHWTVIPAE